MAKPFVPALADGKNYKEFNMKNTLKLFGVIALAAIIGFSMMTVGCDNGSGTSSPNPSPPNPSPPSTGNGSIPAEWQGTYKSVKNPSATFTINGSSGKCANWDGVDPDGTYSGLSIVNGGDVKNDGATGGKWVYLLMDGNKIGFIQRIDVTIPGNPYPKYCCALGKNADGIKTAGLSFGATYSPDIDISSILTKIGIVSFGFDGGKDN
jgi:hypothetical protein